MTETWIQSEGFYPRDSEWDFPSEDEDFPVAVSFSPYAGVYPIFCDCYGIVGDFAVVNIPSRGEELAVTEWFPPEESCWAIVPEIFIRPQ